MIIACPACSTRYVVPETAIGIEGRTVRCAKCKHSWFQDPEPLDLPPREEKSEPTRPDPENGEPTKSAAPPPAEEANNQADRAEPADPAATPSVNYWKTAQAAVERPAAPSEPPPPTDAPAEPAERSDSDGEAHSDADPDLREPDLVGDHEDAATDFEEASPTLAEDSAPDEAFEDDYQYDGDQASQFDYAPPFKARRNPLKMWTLAAAIFALLAIATVVTVNFYGLPEWAPFNRPTFGIGKPELTLDFPVDQQRSEELETGEEIFRVRGSVTNASRDTVSVPSLLVVFRDERDRQVANWVIVPSKRELAPGESLNVTEAIADIPATASFVEIGWSPS